MDIISYLLEHLNDQFEDKSFFYNDAGGPSDPGEGMLSGHKDFADVSDDSCEEGAAASQPSASVAASGSYPLKGSGDHYHYDESSLRHADAGYSDEDDDPDNLYPPSYPPSVEYSGTGDSRDEDARKPFMSSTYDSDVVPRLSRPPSFTSATGDRGGSCHSGLIELQPLISRTDRNMNSPYLPYKPKERYLASTSPLSSHPAPTSPGSVVPPGSRPQSSVNSPTDRCAAPTTDFVNAQTSPIAQASSPSLSHSPSSPPTAASHNGRSFTRRLPPLNDPPGRGRTNLPLSSSGDNYSNFKTRTPPRTSSQLCPESPSTQPLTRPSGSQVYAVEMGAVTDSSRRPGEEESQSEGHRGVASPSDGDGSNDSSKSSGSHSILNGLTNGNVPRAYLRNRTSPC